MLNLFVLSLLVRPQLARVMNAHVNAALMTLKVYVSDILKDTDEDDSNIITDFDIKYQLIIQN